MQQPSFPYPQQNNIQIGAQAPLQGAWTGDWKPVRLNHLYKGGKQCDMPMYNKASDVNPTCELTSKTIIQNLVRS
jgi:hypothetical protein